MSTSRMRQEVRQSIKAAKKLSVEQYRDLIDEVCSKAQDYKSCATDAERVNWLPYAEKVRMELATAVCPRATDRDRLRAADWLSHLGHWIGQAQAIKGAAQ